MLKNIISKFGKRFHIGVLILFAVSGICIIALVVLFSRTTIYRGVRVENIDLSGLDREAAGRKIEQTLSERYATKGFILSCHGKILKFSFEDVSLRFDIPAAVEKAYIVGRSGNIFSRMKDIAATASFGKNIQAAVDFDREKLKGVLIKIKKVSDREAKNAGISYSSGKINVLKGQTGYRLDIDTGFELVENQIRKRNFSKIIIDSVEIKPDIAFEDIREIGAVLGVFSTRFNAADTNRTYNIKLACSRINGMILKPGDIFSMNSALGPRTLENGYREAPVIFENELVPGTGGGVCQVTTTLYNAVLEACFKVVERSSHSMPLAYVKPGQDATIAEGTMDFKFMNDSGYPVCIQAEIKGNTVYIRILGKDGGEGRKVRLVSETVEEILPEEDEIVVDETLSAGEFIVGKESRKGLRARLYREIYDRDGNLLERKKISEDVYKPIRGKLMVSPGYYNYTAGVYVEGEQ